MSDVLEDLKRRFLKERARFAKTYPHVAQTSLRLKRFKRHAERDCCMAVVGGDEPAIIYFHTDVVDRLTPYQQLGLIRHELAHVCDPDLSEAKTDALAEEISTHLIYYGPDDIQTSRWAPGCVRPRPKRLPR